MSGSAEIRMFESPPIEVLGSRLEASTVGDADSEATNIRICLEQRLLYSSRLDEVRQCLNDATTDVVLCSAEKRALTFKSVVLKNMSHYFECIFRSQCKEAASGEIEMCFSFPILQSLVRFFESGEIELSIYNVHQIYSAAQYLQFDCLIGVCQEFLKSKLHSAPGLCLHLASLHADMQDLGVRAATICAEEWPSYRESLLQFPGPLLAAVISQDRLQVAAEDEVVEFVIEWTKHRPRSRKEVFQVLEYIRYPHLTSKGFAQFWRHFRYTRDLHCVSLCLRNRFDEMPEAQLTRRAFYVDHFHLIWRETTDIHYELCTERDPKMIFRVTCLRCSNGDVLSHSTLDTIPNLREKNYGFKFLTVMNSLQFVTHSENLTDIVVHKQRDDQWFLQAAIPRYSKLEEFSACVYQAKIILSMFAGFNKKLKYVEVNSLSSTCRYRELDVCQRTELYKTLFSPTEMRFYDDIVVYLRNHEVEICDRSTGTTTTIKAQTPDVDSGVGISTRFVDFVRAENYLYLYEDKLSVNTSVRRTRGLFDKLYKINLDTKQIEDAIEMRRPVYSQSTHQRTGANHIRKVFSGSSKLLVAQQEAGNEYCSIAQLHLDLNDFSTLVTVRASNTDSHDTYFRLLVEAVPIHVHKCEHETLLQSFCGNLRNPKKHDLLTRLAYYL